MRQYSELLRRYLAPQRAAVLRMALLLIGGTVLQVIGPRVVQRFVDAGRSGAGPGTLVRIALLFLAITAAAQAAKALASYACERVAWTATNALRLDLVTHLLGLDAAFHKDRTPGELIERVDGDVGALAGFFSRMVVQLLGSLLFLGGVLLSLAQIDLMLGATFGGFALATVFVLNAVRRRAVPRQQESREWSARVYGCAGEVLSATEDLRACGAEEYAIGRYMGQLRAWYPRLRAAELSGTAVWLAAMVALAGVSALAYLLGGRLFLLGRISVGTLLAVAYYAADLAQPIETIRHEMQELQRAGAAVVRVSELFALRSALPEGTQPLPAGPLDVEFRNVSFGYEDEQEVLRGFSLKLDAGRVLGVVGRTGCGKSTLARLLFRQYDPSSGEVLVGDVDLPSVKGLSTHVALVTQDVQLFTASLRDNITIFDDTVPDARLRAILADLGLSTWSLDRQVSPGSLSAGEAQLVALARAFLKDPGLVILDEPSSRLDPATEAMLDTAVRRLIRGRTAIIIAHRLETLDLADQILRLEEVAPV
ncbi:MAG TPA: ABC transporter ATP-binding protein [Symbiobacteriaceae bacterium]|nr:ABC transporter ATP-binding protein [Symbiobacteriaceae bacterium]